LRAEPSGREYVRKYRMMILGVVLLILGVVLGSGTAYTAGGVALLIGLILALLGSLDRPILGRRHYW